ncbi:arsenic metallochaperone ArsD family protein [Rhodohalobacter sp.]|uniref:arsenic metallochaperone ArsD family protein n=1 Tax=Rhodohalobacter sp. TaxID=1974210 RepID=UPI002ACE077C|nr:arsenic metallochaperone ArsD family protein [Rhodohalobacter sp.]MDZ7756835.1 arsenic metallochaperone ArsD family protein [Rhodohalobacter sp.]
MTRLKKEGSDVLPIILVNGEVVSEGGYPDRTTLLKFAGLDMSKEAQNNIPMENHAEEL